MFKPSSDRQWNFDYDYPHRELYNEINCMPILEEICNAIVVGSRQPLKRNKITTKCLGISWITISVRTNMQFPPSLPNCSNIESWKDSWLVIELIDYNFFFLFTQLKKK